jgi:predicted nucleic-acid-binding protein
MVSWLEATPTEAALHYRLGWREADFADYVIGRANERGGSQTAFTFDTSLKDCQRFTML